MPVLISRRGAPRPSLPKARLHKLALAMLDYLGQTDCELSLLLCDDQIILDLNARYRSQRKATDVLSFGMEGTTPSPFSHKVLGDVVISLETAARQAKLQHAKLFDEVAFLLAHGLLHLLGMDHDTARKAKLMNRRTRALLRAVGLTPPTGAVALAPKTAVRQAAAIRRKHSAKARPRPQQRRV